MSTLADLLDEHSDLPGAQVAQLQRVVSEWQLLADLSFADFLMWIPICEGAEFVCVAQARPTTAPTAHPQDMVGTRVRAGDHPALRRAMSDRGISREEDPQWHDTVPVRREGIPVTWQREQIAVLGRDTSLGTPRVPGQLEIAYLGCAGDLCRMVADGTFPAPEPSADVHTSPRVGDGLVRIDRGGTVVFASPNAQSAYHRMGYAADLTGTELSPLTRKLIPDPFDAAEVQRRFAAALRGEPSTRFETDAGHGAAVLFRALPLQPGGHPSGALVLIRDVTEVKRRDRALLSKDATIREIHHRVKNNLQTVASLLRLQSRRLPASSQARDVLAESVRRVSAIAMVHETLAMSVNEEVDLDDVLDKVLPAMGDVAAAETAVRVRREGKFGVVRAEVATPLVLVLSELVQNSIEHAYPGGAGEVLVAARRSAKRIAVRITDAGVGLPEEFDMERTDRLGLQIVRILVESELGGSLALQRRENGDSGTEAVLRIPL